MPPRTTFADKETKGTLRGGDSYRRKASEVRQDLHDTSFAIAAMHINLRMAADDIVQNGMRVETVVTDSNGKVVTTMRVNPAFKVQREALSALRSFKRYMTILQEELKFASEDGNCDTNTQNKADEILKRLGKK